MGLAPNHYIEIDPGSAFSGMSKVNQRVLFLGSAQGEEGIITNPKEIKGSLLEGVQGLKEAAPRAQWAALLTKDFKDILLEEDFTHLVILDEDVDLIRVKALMDLRWQSPYQKDGCVFFARYDSKENLQKLARDLNSPYMVLIPMKNPEESGARWAGAMAGMAHSPTPSRPYQTLEIPGISSPSGFSLLERDELLSWGIATWKKSGAQILIDRLVTTYTQTPGGAMDPSYRDLNTIQTLSYLRFDLIQGLTRDFPRHMLALSDDFPYNDLVVTPKVLKMWIVARYRRWQEAGLTQDPEGMFSKTLMVEGNKDQPGKVDVQMAPHLMGQYLQTQIKMAFKI